MALVQAGNARLTPWLLERKTVFNLWNQSRVRLGIADYGSIHDLVTHARAALSVGMASVDSKADAQRFERKRKSRGDTNMERLEYDFPAPGQLSLWIMRDEGSVPPSMFARWDGEAWTFVDPFSSAPVNPTLAETEFAESSRTELL